MIASGLPFGILLLPFGAPWLLFGSLWRPLALFWFPLTTLGSLLVRFSAASGSILMPFRSSGSLLLRLSLHFRDFFNFKFVLAFYTFGLLGVPFLVALPMQTQFLSTKPRRNPQQNYWRISTVGTQTFLGPGRVCCRRQLKIDDEIDPVQITW